MRSRGRSLKRDDYVEKSIESVTKSGNSDFFVCLISTVL